MQKLFNNVLLTFFRVFKLYLSLSSISPLKCTLPNVTFILLSLLENTQLIDYLTLFSCTFVVFLKNL